MVWGMWRSCLRETSSEASAHSAAHAIASWTPINNTTTRQKPSKQCKEYDLAVALAVGTANC